MRSSPGRRAKIQERRGWSERQSSWRAGRSVAGWLVGTGDSSSGVSGSLIGKTAQHPLAPSSLLSFAQWSCRKAQPRKKRENQNRATDPRGADGGSAAAARRFAIDGLLLRTVAQGAAGAAQHADETDRRAGRTGTQLQAAHWRQCACALGACTARGPFTTLVSIDHQSSSN